jgi:hypothetical protein
MVKRLTMKDQLSREQYLQRVSQYTDEDAHRLGYPSVEVLRLEIKLGEIAGKWRYNQDDESLVLEYERVLYKMILKGYDVNTLPIQDQLPDRLMPELPPEPVQAAIQRIYQAK